MNKFSIITCTYNSSKYLKRNLESINNQTFKDFEHIFIDGFSSDGTLDIINEYKKENPDRVKVFQFKPEGISAAMNKGVELSVGEYLIHLHSDDSFYDNEVLSDVSVFLRDRDVDWIYGKINVFNKEGDIGLWPNRKIFQKYKEKDCSKKHLLKYYNYIPHQAVFIKKSVFDRFGLFDENLKSSMDPDFWLRIRKDTKWVFLNRVISNFCLRSDAQSSGYKNRDINRESKMLVKKRHLNKFEFLIYLVVDFFVSIKSKNYQK